MSTRTAKILELAATATRNIEYQEKMPDALDSIEDMPVVFDYNLKMEESHQLPNCDTQYSSEQNVMLNNSPNSSYPISEAIISVLDFTEDPQNVLFSKNISPNTSNSNRISQEIADIVDFPENPVLTDISLNYISEERITEDCASTEKSDVQAYNDNIYVPDESNPSDSDYTPENDSDESTSADSDRMHEDRGPELHNEYGNMAEGRKRCKKSNPENWKKTKTKMMRMLGREYLGYTRSTEGKVKHNKIRSTRKMGPRCTSRKCQTSKVRFCSKFPEEIREKIFSEFWCNMTWDQRKVFVSSHVTRSDTKRCTKGSGESSRRTGTFVYTLNNGHVNLTVCREMFLNTLALKPFTVQSWVKNSVLSMHTGKENLNKLRRENSHQHKKSSSADIPLTEFFNQLAKLPSHYVRRDSTKLYLDEKITTLSSLYDIYKDYCKENNITSSCRKVFERKFHEMNLSLFRPKKDMCDLCCEHKAGNKEDSVWRKHILDKDQARKQKEDDKEHARNNELILLTMDLQAVKVAPCLNASGIYFKTKLCCHNFTVFDCGSSDATCYWFTETESTLCASTFVSCLLDYLERHCLQKKLPVVIFSDGCTFQNRNAIMANALLNVSMLHNVTITQKFLERGHTQMECDSVHSCIERKLKNRIIQLPSDYLKATLEARKNPKPYEAFLLDYNFFKDYSKVEFLRYLSIRPGKKVDDPTVTHIKQIRYSEGKIEVKLSFEEEHEWKLLPVRPKNIPPITIYPRLNSSRLPIPEKKYKHLQSLKSVLTFDCHNFYDNIPHKDQ